MMQLVLWFLFQVAINYYPLLKIIWCLQIICILKREFEERFRLNRLSFLLYQEASLTTPSLYFVTIYKFLDQDRSNARNAPEVAKCLSLQQESAGVVAACWAVACVCGVTGDGLDEALATLRQLLDKGSAQNSKQRTKPLDIWRWF